MATALPHSSITNAQFSEYLDEIKDLAETRAGIAKQRPHLRALFKTCTAGFAVLNRIARGNHAALRAIPNRLRRLPMLVALGQPDMAFVELRRVAELAAWGVYFREHPVEWKALLEDPELGFVRENEQPIKWAAHRECRYYLRYARERLASDPSKLGREACDRLLAALGPLSAQVHPGHAIKPKGGAVPVAELDDAMLLSIADCTRQVVKDVSLMLLAVRPQALGRMLAVERAWLDWLIGSHLRKQLRAGPFGLQE